MLDLSNIFNKDMKKAIMSKEKLAEMLRVTPEALKAFEKSYQLHSMRADQRQPFQSQCKAGCKFKSKTGCT